MRFFIAFWLRLLINEIKSRDWTKARACVNILAWHSFKRRRKNQYHLYYVTKYIKTEINKLMWAGWNMSSVLEVKPKLILIAWTHVKRRPDWSWFIVHTDASSKNRNHVYSQIMLIILKKKKELIVPIWKTNFSAIQKTRSFYTPTFNEIKDNLSNMSEMKFTKNS